MKKCWECGEYFTDNDTVIEWHGEDIHDGCKDNAERHAAESSLEDQHESERKGL